MNRLYRPRSFLSLLLTGFLFVSLPLFIALISAIQIMDGDELRTVHVTPELRTVHVTPELLQMLGITPVGP